MSIIVGRQNTALKKRIITIYDLLVTGYYLLFTDHLTLKECILWLRVSLDSNAHIYRMNVFISKGPNSISNLRFPDAIFLLGCSSRSDSTISFT